LRDAGELELMDELLTSIRKRNGAATSTTPTTPGVRIP
jgi:hypothetical protein